MRHAVLFSTLCLLAACDSGGGGAVTVTNPVDDTPPPAVTEASFEVSATNLTVGQPLSPLAVAIHDSSLSVFEVGTPVSVALEVLAEGGDNSELLAEIDSVAQASGEAPVGPGASDTLTLTLTDDQTAGLSLSVVTMLVNTNDAITGLNSVDVSGLAVGETLNFAANAYDAGTESNSEQAGTIPGPADGGEGFNEARDDVGDFLTMHPGVVTADDGLTDSALNQVHRFDNPVARISITRVQ